MAEEADDLDDADVERVSAVLADVYDAAVDPDLWHVALESACDLVGCEAGFLYLQDLAGRAGDACFAWGDDPAHRAPCFEIFARHNPLHAAAPEPALGQVTAGTGLMPEATLKATPFGSGWLQPQNFCDFAAVALERSNVSLTWLAFAKGGDQGCMSEAELRRIGWLAPHFRRASAIAEALGQRKLEVEAFAEVLDRLSAGVLLVDPAGSVVHANRNARRMLEEADVLHARRDVLRARDAGADRVLQAALKGSGGARPAGPIRLATEGDAHLAYVLPLTAGQRRSAGARFSAAAAVFVHRVKLDVTSALDALGQLYHLTPAELRVLGAAADAAGTREVAEALHLSEHTVNTHLKHLFAKTGVRRKDELVKLLATHASPAA